MTQPEGAEDRLRPWEMFDVGASQQDTRREASSVSDDVIARCLEGVQRLLELPQYAVFAKTPKPSQFFKSASGELLPWPFR